MTTEKKSVLTPACFQVGTHLDSGCLAGSPTAWLSPAQPPQQPPSWASPVLPWAKQQAPREQPGLAKGWKGNTPWSVMSALPGPEAKAVVSTQGGGRWAFPVCHLRVLFSFITCLFLCPLSSPVSLSVQLAPFLFLNLLLFYPYLTFLKKICN